ncbi:hypothetical protein ASD91_10080 [Pseudomonas sp. Root68]|nr:hypothetical protein ASD91_10080 [Pseudomonas sp. Root68]KRB65674.1 hypothetical protein ASD95_09385 [Pseudomonas sp. Root71]
MVVLRFLVIGVSREMLCVGAAAGCDLLILFFQDQDQKIAACGSSYRRFAVFLSGADQSAPSFV